MQNRESRRSYVSEQDLSITVPSSCRSLLTPGLWLTCKLPPLNKNQIYCTYSSPSNSNRQLGNRCGFCSLLARCWKKCVRKCRHLCERVEILHIQDWYTTGISLAHYLVGVNVVCVAHLVCVAHRLWRRTNIVYRWLSLFYQKELLYDERQSAAWESVLYPYAFLEEWLGSKKLLLALRVEKLLYHFTVVNGRTVIPNMYVCATCFCVCAGVSTPCLYSLPQYINWGSVWT
jgi:hypothetical protein